MFRTFKSHEMVLAEVESYNSKRISFVSVHAIELSWVSMAKGGKFPEGKQKERKRERREREREIRASDVRREKFYSSPRHVE